MATACGLSEFGESSGSRDVGAGIDGTSGDATNRDAPSANDATGAHDAPEKGDSGSLIDAHMKDDAPTPACPGKYGPMMVSVGGFCIDSTEVTSAQYGEFLDAGYNPDAQPSYCSWNVGNVCGQTFVPNGAWPPADASLPVTYVNWCDAHAYCAWAGKRLCGQIGGGSVDQDNADHAGADQWFFACSDGGELTYPYGDTYIKGACNDNNANMGDQIVEAPKSFPECVGGFPGVYDMSGNVSEWEDSCNHENNGGDQCNERGGSVNNNPGMVTCANIQTENRSTTSSHVGFRCCAP
jgi:formylglycine-generating enzyme